MKTFPSLSFSFNHSPFVGTIKKEKKKIEKERKRREEEEERKLFLSNENE